jgi:hypothetical protein
MLEAVDRIRREKSSKSSGEGGIKHVKERS